MRGECIEVQIQAAALILVRPAGHFTSNQCVAPQHPGIPCRARGSRRDTSWTGWAQAYGLDRFVVRLLNNRSWHWEWVQSFCQRFFVISGEGHAGRVHRRPAPPRPPPAGESPACSVPCRKSFRVGTRPLWHCERARRSRKVLCQKSLRAARSPSTSTSRFGTKVRALLPADAMRCSYHRTITHLQVRLADITTISHCASPRGVDVRAQTASQSVFRRRYFHARQRVGWAYPHAHAGGPEESGVAHAPCLPHLQRCARCRIFFAVPHATRGLCPVEGAAHLRRAALRVACAGLGFGPEALLILQAGAMVHAGAIGRASSCASPPHGFHVVANASQVRHSTSQSTHQSALIEHVRIGVYNCRQFSRQMVGI
jgi:hypothetical protein